MALETIYRGEDIDLLFTLNDADGDPLVINDLAGVIIWVVNKSTGGVLGKFRRDSPSGDYGAITVVSSNDGQVSVKLTAAQTKGADLGCLVAEVKIRITTSSNFDSIDPVTIAKLADAATKNDTDFS